MSKIKPYRRIYRVCPKMYRKLLEKVPKYLLDNIADPPKRKKCLSVEEVKELLKGHVTIEEKIDGGVLGLAWGGVPLVVGKHSMVHYDASSKKFYGLSQWIYEHYEQISQIPLGWIIYGEWMRAQHNIPYVDLRDYFVGFDVWDGNKKRFLNIIDRSIFLDSLGFAEVPVIYSGTDLGIEDLICITEGVGGVGNTSIFNCDEIIEGIIIRNDNGFIGKYVRREFMNSIEENWINLPLIENKLRSWKRNVEF
jgi:hypothetical protein